MATPTKCEEKRQEDANPQTGYRARLLGKETYAYTAPGAMDNRDDRATERSGAKEKEEGATLQEKGQGRYYLKQHFLQIHPDNVFSLVFSIVFPFVFSIVLSLCIFLCVCLWKTSKKTEIVMFFKDFENLKTWISKFEKHGKYD